MKNTIFPSLFISHGAPNIVLQNTQSNKNINSFSKTLRKPKYIIIFSSHYLTKDLKIINYTTKDLMYDFYGFERELYEYKYDISSNKEISLKVFNHLKENGIDVSIDALRTSFDHGVWTCLALMYEKIDIPIIQLSLPYSYSYEELIHLGEIVKELKDEAMIIGSGGVTHNLRDISHSNEIKKYAKEFNEIVIKTIEEADEDSLINITKEKSFYQNHPSTEHFIPLYIIYGSAYNKKGSSFNSEFMYSNISMESFAFDKGD